MHLAQVNIARMRAPLDDPAMAGFVARLDEINALAEASAGFVWRLAGAEGNNVYLRPYDDERILFNMSVWQSLEHLQDYVYRSAHAELLRGRGAWFEKSRAPSIALFWVATGSIPSVEDGKRRLAHLEEHGPTPYAFTFKRAFARGAAVPNATRPARPPPSSD